MTTEDKRKSAVAEVKALLEGDGDRLRLLLQHLLQGGAGAGDDRGAGGRVRRTHGGPAGYRAGHYPRSLVTRVGKLELRVPRDRDGRFSTELFERCQRSEQALVGTLAEMYIQGVSWRGLSGPTPKSGARRPQRLSRRGMYPHTRRREEIGCGM